MTLNEIEQILGMSNGGLWFLVRMAKFILFLYIEIVLGGRCHKCRSGNDFLVRIY
jgi:hypothetical protein